MFNSVTRSPDRQLMKVVGISSCCFLIALLTAANPAFSAEIMAAKIVQALPTIGPFEKFCLLTAKPEGLESCLKTRPATPLHQRAIKRSQQKLNTLNKLAVGIEMNDGLDTWTNFCLLNTSASCLDDCINGFVCPSE